MSLAVEGMSCGGCESTIKASLQSLPGIQAVSVDVAAGKTEVRYDPAVVSYDDLLQVFWLNIDPTTPNRQFCDRGAQYRSAIFPADDAQRTAAERSLALVKEQKPFDDPVVTLIEPLEAFYAAEAYHQDYYRKSALRYRSYKYACGRKQRLDALWGDATSAFVVPG